MTTLELEPAPATRVDAPGLAGGDSLVTRALDLLAARTGHGTGWRVHIDKHVPVGAGLGGGSADAATALGLANATLPEPLAPGRLIALAAEVGSDVPFFVSGHETALARGRGELLEPCPLGAPAWVVTAWPGVALGTAEVYARYRAPAGAAATRGRAHGRAVRDRRCRAARRSRRERPRRAPAAELCPPVAALRARLLASGALAACMSGSGSAVFGLFAGEDAAREAGERLRGGAAWISIGRLTQTRRRR